VTLFSPISVLSLNLLIQLCSGEKVPEVKWSQSIVVKGNVKLQDFEKYIQELPLSRNKELMVKNSPYYIYLSQY